MTWFPRRTVVVPVDFSTLSLRAVEIALELVNDPAELWVVYVVPVDDLGDPWMPRREHALAQLQAQFESPRHAGIHTEVLYGDPGTEITTFAEEKLAELIVISSHGRTGFARFLLGSVAERVLRLAHCPVLIVR